MKYLFHIITLLTVSCIIVQAQSISELNKRRKKAEDEIAYINKLLTSNANKKKSGLEQLSLAQQKITQRKQMIADIDMQIHIVERDLESKNQHIDDLQKYLETLKKSYEDLIYQAYKFRNKDTWIMFVMSSDDFGMAYRRWQYFRRFSEHINELAKNIKETTGKINTEIEALLSKRKELASYLSEKQTEMNTLEKERQETQKMIKDLSGHEKKLRTEMDHQRKVINNINKQLERIITEEAKKKSKEGTPLPVDKALNANFENNRGNLPWPVRKGIIVSRFGNHKHPVYKNVDLPTNNGIDISTEAKSTAISVFNGKVTRIVNIPGMNSCVMVQHGEYFTLYCKLGELAVQSGDNINAGQKIGTIVTGAEGTTILHFELWKGTQKQNPELWLAK